MDFYVWARTEGTWKIVAITREESDAIAVFDRHEQSYIGNGDSEVIRVKG